MISNAKISADNIVLSSGGSAVEKAIANAKNAGETAQRTASNAAQAASNAQSTANTAVNKAKAAMMRQLLRNRMLLQKSKQRIKVFQH